MSPPSPLVERVADRLVGVEAEAREAGFGQVQLDGPVYRPRVAVDDGPIGLFRPPAGEGAGELGGGGGTFTKHQDTRGVAIQAVGETWTLQPLTPRRQQPIDVMRGLGAALYGEAGGVVRAQPVLLFEQHHGTGGSPIAASEALSGISGARPVPAP